MTSVLLPFRLLHDVLRWLVFKAKQKAETNYYNKTYLKTGQTKPKVISGTNASEYGPDDPLGINKGITYNWPYDFFSLVELVKIDAEVDLNQTEMSEDEDKIIIKPIINKNIMNIKKEEFDKVKVTEVKKDEFLE